MVYGRYNYSIHGGYKPTNITGGHHLVTSNPPGPASKRRFFPLAGTLRVEKHLSRITGVGNHGCHIIYVYNIYIYITLYMIYIYIYILYVYCICILYIYIYISYMLYMYEVYIYTIWG